MNELKAYIVYTSSEGVLGLWKSYSIRIEGAEVYLKSEADKVIAEKDAEIAELKALKAQAEDDCAYWKMCHGNAANAMHETEEYAMQLYKESRHQKYKRCLAMAQWCMDAECKTEKDADFLVRWEHRWLALAEEPTWAKFLQLIHKEAK